MIENLTYNNSNILYKMDSISNCRKSKTIEKSNAILQILCTTRWRFGGVALLFEQ